jgi:hypothetical protein
MGHYQRSAIMASSFSVNLDRTADHPLSWLVEFHPSCPFESFVVVSGYPS